MKMHDGHNNNQVRSNPKQDAEWERPNKASPNIAFNEMKYFGIEFDLVEGVLNRREIAFPQSLLPGLVPPGRFNHFRGSFGMETQHLHRSAA